MRKIYPFSKLPKGMSRSTKTVLIADLKNVNFVRPLFIIMT